jgi:hypothetical protein
VNDQMQASDEQSSAAPSDPFGPTAYDPSVRSRNIKHGLVLVAFVVLSMSMFMVLFGQRGLPKDPKFFPKIDQRAQADASSASGQTNTPSTLSTAPLSLDSASAEPSDANHAPVPLRPKETVDE